MIGKQDLVDRASEWGLRPDVVEKDYALGWLLSALATHPATSRLWIFKGGTCLKKCYYETFRFSEDLDFTLRPDAPYTADTLTRTLREVAEIAANASGIGFPPERAEVRARKDKRGLLTFAGKLSYQGPLAFPTAPRITFDITQHELIVDEPVQRAVHHPYPDELGAGEGVMAYSLDELFGEKLRALCERTRPRDLYDVVNVLSNARELLDLDLARRIFQEKCRFKGLAVPTAAAIAALATGSEELAAEWENMLAHQLPELPPLTTFLERLLPLLDWIDGPKPEVVAAPLQSFSGGSGETIVSPAGVTYWNEGQPLELLRFAGANHLLVELHYNGKRRLAEPYSLRRAANGNLLFYAWEQGASTIKAFKVSELSGLRSTKTPFVPRYRVDLTRLPGN
ncbi:MAG: nucleotidyl transferase AbiEii/AbiGii toxin family protein [Planctomycetes bacterium]|nr:nucleotidyl transferase AbiEii/AbiGii toxin family protein [Planctomycetota bacterium]